MIVVQRIETVVTVAAGTVITELFVGQFDGNVTVCVVGPVTGMLKVELTVKVPLVGPPGGPQGSSGVHLSGGPLLISGHGGRKTVRVVVPVPPDPGIITTVEPRSTLGVGVNTQPGRTPSVTLTFHMGI